MRQTGPIVKNSNVDNNLRSRPIIIRNIFGESTLPKICDVRMELQLTIPSLHHSKGISYYSIMFICNACSDP